MPQFVQLPVSGDVTVVVEAAPSDAIVEAGRLRDIADAGMQSVEDAMSGLTTAAHRAFEKALNAATPPDQVTVQFAVQLASEAGVVVARTAASANMSVTFTWTVRKGDSDD